MKFTRFIPITSSAVATTFSLFYVMQGLVMNDELQIDETQPQRLIPNIQMPDEPPKPRTIDRIPKPKKALPPPHRRKPSPPVNPNSGNGSITAMVPPILPKGEPVTLQFAQMDGDRMPLVRVAPEYPRRCAERGISGWVMLQFDVDEYGAVENPSVIDADPSRCFNRSALKTIMRFKYKPTILNGQARPSTGVRFRMVFSMDEG